MVSHSYNAGGVTGANDIGEIVGENCGRLESPCIGGLYVEVPS